MRTLANDPLNGSGTAVALPNWIPSPLSTSPWTYLAPGTGAGDLEVVTAGLNSAATTTVAQPIAYWSAPLAGGATWSDDQWAQCALSSSTGAYGLGLVLRASGTQCFICEITPTANNLRLLFYLNYSPSSMGGTALGGAYLIAPSSPVLQVNQVIRCAVQGTGSNTVASVWRSLDAGVTFTLLNSMTPNGTGAPSLAITGGRPGVMADRSGALWGIRNFQAGDFASAIQPPTSPTGPQGAFTVRTT